MSETTLVNWLLDILDNDIGSLLMSNDVSNISFTMVDVLMFFGLKYVTPLLLAKNIIPEFEFPADTLLYVLSLKPAPE
jgi:hypothetical protein